MGSNQAGDAALWLKSSGALDLYLDGSLAGTSATTFSSPGWHWVGVRSVTGTSVPFLQIDGVDQVVATATMTLLSAPWLGCVLSESSALDIYFDDVITDSAGLIGPSKVDMAMPISDNATGTGWQKPGGSTTNLYTSVDNVPPNGVADSTSATYAENQIRNATAAASSNYDVNLETYTTLGITSQDTLLSVMPVVVTAAPVATQAKAGKVGNASNPAITTIDLAANSSNATATNFWNGTAAGTFATGWKVSPGTLTTSPSVTLGSSPVMRITQVTSSTRIADVCFMGLVVAWTPKPPVTGSFPVNSVIKRTQTPTFKADALSAGIWGWIDPPADGVTMAKQPVLTFKTPTHPTYPCTFQIQLDTVNTFNSGDLRTYTVGDGVGTWEYDSTGSGNWVSMPSTGVPDAYKGKSARFTVPTDLTNTTWYRRFRYSVK